MGNHALINSYPVAEVAPGVYEIDEFDCASAFLVVGDERALLMDTGVGIGNMCQAVERLTKGLPCDVVLTHAHFDHIGGAQFFDRVYMHPLDFEGYPFPPKLEDRRSYAEFIRNRSGLQYPYDPDLDMPEWTHVPERLPLEDGTAFDLGGRTVTAYHCPGHTAGELVLVDDRTRILFAGDAVNGLLLYDVSDTLGATRVVSVEQAYRALRRVIDMKNFDCIYNFHHDFRPFGKPLPDEILTSVLTACEQLISGQYTVTHLPGMMPGYPPRTAVVVGPVTLCFKEAWIHDA